MSTKASDASDASTKPSGASDASTKSSKPSDASDASTKPSGASTKSSSSSSSPSSSSPSTKKEMKISYSLDAYHRRQCKMYRTRIEDALRCIEHLSQTKHITSMIGLLLSTTRWRWQNHTQKDNDIESSYEEVFLYRRLLDEMYVLSSESETAEDAYLAEWHRFLRLARTVLRRMEDSIESSKKAEEGVEDVEGVEDIEDVEDVEDT